MIVIVLGMHRSGTSLVSSVLHAMGVRMGEPSHLERRDPQSQPSGYWEDQDFVSLNRQIISRTGGHWHRPPARDNILKAALGFEKEMRALIAMKQATVDSLNVLADNDMGPSWIGWGWKDPRNCLTMEAWWPHIAMQDVRFVRVRRRQEGIVDSLIRRGEQLGGVPADKQAAAWLAIIEHHEKRITNFFIRTGTKDKSVEVEFEHLVRPDGALVMLTRIATLLGLQGADYVEAMRAGTHRIEFRE